MKGIPSNWKITLKQCNFALAKRELSEFIQITNSAAEMQGHKACFNVEFVNGWYEFAENPCYKTAIAWFKKAPDYATMLFDYFEGACPGGKLYKVGFNTATSFCLGELSLETFPYPSVCLTELTEREYLHFPRQHRNEVIYHASPINFLEHRWDIMIGMIDGIPYKLGVSIELSDKEQAVKLIQVLFKNCEVQLGTPTDEKQGLFIWDTTDGNVILQTASVMGDVAINVFATSNKISGKSI